MRKSRPSEFEHNEVFNPLDTRHLAESIATALLRREPRPLPPPREFEGNGLYALYYVGSHKAYKKLAALNDKRDPSLPIYVGRAIEPPGKKKRTKKLYNRLRKHARSIEATDLKVEDFRCRYLVVEDTFIALGESLLIDWYKPLWNQTVLWGFGSNAPGKGRKGQKKSPWDTFHPGRGAAKRLRTNAATIKELATKIKSFLAQVSAPSAELHVPFTNPQGRDVGTATKRRRSG